MENSELEKTVPTKSLRLWPAVAIAVLQVLLQFVLPAVYPGGTIIAMLGGMVCALAIFVWWLIFSRAVWPERLAAIVLMVVALALSTRILHQSIANGMMGMMYFFHAIPALSLAFVIWAFFSRRFSVPIRRASMVATIFLACSAWALIRTGGVTGEGKSDLHWRWSKSPEELLLTQANDEPLARPTPLPSTKFEFDWSGFRGPNRDSIVRGAQIETDWTKSPPVELWRRPIGPGWSSFAARSDRIFTQEQRGEDEIVCCYSASTGQTLWRHSDATRFWESNAGAGPRATPVVNNGRVYTLGATGIVNALEAEDGRVVWSRNAVTDTDVAIPGWGICGSPLIFDDNLVIAVSGRLVAYELASGAKKWVGPSLKGSYSSPHILTKDGVTQIVLLSGVGAFGVAASDGALLWQHDWPGTAILQPALLENGDLLIATSSASGGMGLRRIAVAHGPNGWSASERWTSVGLKPYFNDFVVHNGHAFGFDGSILACIDLQNGQRKWKGGRYGNGQLLLLADQNLLLVISEDGELALVGATPEKFAEFSRFPGIKGKTWNHPVLVGDVLFVRNGEEMAAFRLSLTAPRTAVAREKVGP